MEERSVTQRSNRIVSSQLEQELAGFEERGLRSSRTRMPGKSYLPKVLLSSNPLVERDLQKTLTQIHQGRSRRQKVWEWNQRHFFVNQIFDPDYNLRFTRGLKKYSADLDQRSSLQHSRRSSQFRNNVPNADVEDKDIIGLGVFMPPLHPSQRLIEKQKIPNSTPVGGRGRFGLSGAMSSPDLVSSTEQIVYEDKQPKIYREKHVSETEIGTKLNHKDTTSKARQRRVTLASAKCTSSTGKIHKAASLPEIPLYRSVTFDSPQKPHLEVTEDIMPPEPPKINHQNSKQEVLCQDRVILNLTRSLPLSVMIKANQNINKVVQRRKAEMIERCKTARDKNSFEDPRWKDLENILEASTKT